MLSWLFCGALRLTNPTGSSRSEFINPPQQPTQTPREIINQSPQPGPSTAQRINRSGNWWICALIHQAVTYSRPSSLSVLLADWQGQLCGQQPEPPALAEHSSRTTLRPWTRPCPCRSSHTLTRLWPRTPQRGRDRPGRSVNFCFSRYCQGRRPSPEEVHAATSGVIKASGRDASPRTAAVAPGRGGPDRRGGSTAEPAQALPRRLPCGGPCGGPRGGGEGARPGPQPCSAQRPR